MTVIEHRILICEDDAFQANRLKEMVTNAAIMAKDVNVELNVAKVITKYDDAVKWINTMQFKSGIYFLDIELSSKVYKAGFNLAEQIKAIDTEAIIVFITSHEELALETFVRRIEPIDYIVKQVDETYMQRRITETLELIVNRLKERKYTQAMMFKYSSGRRIFTINMDDIYCISTTIHAHKLELISRNGRASFTGVIKQIEQEYDDLTKISQSCLVNFKNVSQVDYKKMKLIFPSGREEYFSRRFARVIKEKMK